LVAPPARAQSFGATLEERLAALEHRVDQLEQENHVLKSQLGSLASGPGLVGLAATPQGASPATAQPAAPPPHSEIASASFPEPGAHTTASAPTAKSDAQTQGGAEAKSERLQFGGQIRLRAEGRQNADLNSRLPDLQDFIGQRLRFHVRAKLSDTVETFVQFQDSRLWGQEISTLSNDRLTDLHQGYLQVNDLLKPGLYLRAGRQELIYGAERLIGAAGWDNIGRTFDAVKMGYSSRNWSSDWFAAKVVDRRDTSRGDRDQYLYGIYNQFFRRRPQHLEVYGIFFRDGLRTAGEIDSLGRKATQIMTLGFRSDGKLEPGINYEVEFADQFGHRGFDPHSARALAAKMYKTVEETHQLRLGFEYDVASGDRNPHDGRSGEFFNLFPTNHQYYGYADLMGWRNMQDFRPMFTVAPVRPVRFDVDYHRLYLLEARGPWKDAGGNVLGFDPMGQSGTHVGDELDFTLGFPIHKAVKILSGYSLFFPGAVARNTRGKDRQDLFYLQTLVDF
jgi:hypothetical protein